MITDLYTIKTLSNLHVGSGDINFDLVDNQVQRDEITNFPCINSSSLKGAFREHFSKEENTKGMVKYIFGPDNSSNDSHQTGAYSFFEAQLLTRAVRSNKKAYLNATTSSIIKDFLSTVNNFSIDFDMELRDSLEDFSQLSVEDTKPLIFENIEDLIVEDEKAIYHNFDMNIIETFLGKDITLLSENDFKNLELPIIARNQLENGESKNLWYEEVVPKKSTFYFCIAKPSNVDEKDYKEKIKGFDNRFENEGEIVQIGANRSIGYGFCKIKKVVK